MCYLTKLINNSSNLFAAASQIDNTTLLKRTSENEKIIYSQETIHPLTYMTNFSKFEIGKNFHLKNSRCKSAPIFMTQNKSENTVYCNRILSSAPKSKTPTLPLNQQQYQNSKIPKPGISSLQEKTFEKQEIFTSYR